MRNNKNMEEIEMYRQALFEWVRDAYGTEPDYPWNNWNAVLRHKDNDKWYGLVLEVSKKKLGLDEDSLVDVLNVKCDPVLVGALREQPGYFPAYHMNKEKWISILLDGTVAVEDIKNLIEISYELTNK